MVGCVCVCASVCGKRLLLSSPESVCVCVWCSSALLHAFHLLVWPAFLWCTTCVSHACLHRFLPACFGHAFYPAILAVISLRQFFLFHVFVFYIAVRHLLLCLLVWSSVVAAAAGTGVKLGGGGANVGQTWSCLCCQSTDTQHHVCRLSCALNIKGRHARTAFSGFGT